eukprot:TRINITY_DN28940_c0_g1_i1.p1 TRINITY_DN28940_c0_g1~~TRINITY_DN28940_c0_g1_i1.p1  ORF type:complete len:293 (+),score=40.92 TRINITY_DN28940_c0_g1_i1:56-934(+)
MQSEAATGSVNAFSWIFDRDTGFFGMTGVLLEELGLMSELRKLRGERCAAVYEDIGGVAVRWPFLAALCLLGVVTGIVGVGRVRYPGALSHYYYVAFTFFAYMNLSGLFYHCLLPVSEPARAFPRVIDQASTGICGAYLAVALLKALTMAIPTHPLRPVFTFLDSIRGIFTPAAVVTAFAASFISRQMGEAIYLSGIALIAVSAAFILLNYTSLPPTPISTGLKGMLFVCTVFVLGVVPMTVASGDFCERYNGKGTAIDILFFWSAFGYIGAAYYGGIQCAHSDAKGHAKKE